jgi:hypothetical protein
MRRSRGLLVVALVTRNGRRRVLGHRLDVAFAAVFREDQAPLDIVAFRTHEGVSLEARDRHGVVLDHVHEDHLGAARHTTHRTHS